MTEDKKIPEEATDVSNPFLSDAESEPLVDVADTPLDAATEVVSEPVVEAVADAAPEVAPQVFSDAEPNGADAFLAPADSAADALSAHAVESVSDPAAQQPFASEEPVATTAFSQPYLADQQAAPQQDVVQGQPFDQGQQPIGQMQQPFDQAQQPFETAQQPYDQAQQPYDPTRQSYQQPFDQVQQPYSTDPNNYTHTQQAAYQQGYQQAQQSYAPSVAPQYGAPAGSDPGTAPLIMGIISIVCAVVLWPTVIGPVVGIILGVIGIVKARSAQQIMPQSTRARPGKITSIIGLVLSILSVLFGIMLTAMVMFGMSQMDESDFDMLQEEVLKELREEGYDIPGYMGSSGSGTFNVTSDQGAYTFVLDDAIEA
ncbi:MAG: hypothetical protein IJ131_03600 [Eggerthellaceae bacterium]|nr:hypothetical protein [Eggerthellaceae bacterium]